MGTKLFMATALALCCSLAASGGMAAEGVQTPTPAQMKEKAAQEVTTATKERVYGSQLMTRQERAEYRSKMRAAKTAEERELLRSKHHEQMKARAAERGVTLPDEPPATGMGKGIGPGGRGMGPGQGRR